MEKKRHCIQNVALFDNLKTRKSVKHVHGGIMRCTMAQQAIFEAWRWNKLLIGVSRSRFTSELARNVRIKV